MSATKSEVNIDPKAFDKFLRQNKDLDWKCANLLAESQVDKFDWKGLEADKAFVFKQVKAYQRLARVLEADDPKLIKALMKENIHSAIQIAALPKKEFKRRCEKLFKKDDEKMEQVHKRAVAIRSELLIRYMNRIQNSEPHTAQVKTL